MGGALAYGSAAVLAATGIALALLVARRTALARHERHRLEAEARLRPFALALADGDGPAPPRLGEADAVVFADLLGRYARRLRGSSADRIAEFFEANGAVARELAAVRSRRPWRRATAAYVLGDMRSATAVPALLAALDDPRRDVRAAAARSLGRLAAVEAVAPLVDALAADRVPPAVAGFALVEIGPAAVPALRPLLHGDDPAIRARAAEVIGLVGDAGDGEALTGLLRDPSAEVRARCARALGRLGAEDAAAALRLALDDRVAFVRTAAAHALGAIRDGDAFERLLRQATTDDHDPAQAAAAALAAIDPALLAEVARSAAPGPHVLEAADLAAA